MRQISPGTVGELNFQQLFRNGETYHTTGQKHFHFNRDNGWLFSCLQLSSYFENNFGRWYHTLKGVIQRVPCGKSDEMPENPNEQRRKRICMPVADTAPPSHTFQCVIRCPRCGRRSNRDRGFPMVEPRQMTSHAGGICLYGASQETRASRFISMAFVGSDSKPPILNS